MPRKLLIVWLLPAFCCATAPLFSNGVSVGKIDSSELDEASGIAASRKHPGILYSHNDHGDRPRLFAINATNAKVVATLEISPGAQLFDWEDLAVGICERGSKQTCIYILDDGEYHHHDMRTVYRVPEPDTMIHQTIAPNGVLKYNWTEHGSDTLMVDQNANLFVIATVLGGRGMIVQLPQVWNQTNAVFVDSGSYFSMESKHHDPSGGDISPSGGEVIVKNEEEVYYWSPVDGDIMGALIHPGDQLPYRKEPLGEAICWSYDGSAYYTLSEGHHQDLYKYERVQP